MPPIFSIWRELLAQVVQVELALAHLLGDAQRLLLVDRLRRLLDEGDDVAHAEDAVGDALRGGTRPARPSSRRCRQLDRLAGDGAHRERRAAAAVAVHAGQHDAGDADPLVEGARGVHGVLAGQRVGDQQHLVRVGDGLDLGDLGHQRLVDGGAAGGVEHHDVVAAEPRRPPARAARSARRSGRRRSAASSTPTCWPSTASCSMAAGRRVSSEASSTFLLLAVGQPLGDLGGGGRLARALQADHQDRHRRHGVEVDRVGLARPASRPASSWTILTTIWPGVTDLITSAPTARALHLVGEGAHDLERDVGLDQRAADLAHRRVDVLLASARRGRVSLSRMPESFSERPSNMRSARLSFRAGQAARFVAIVVRLIGGECGLEVARRRLERVAAARDCRSRP